MLIILGVSAASGVPSEEELSALPAAELAALLAGAYRVIGELHCQRAGHVEMLGGGSSMPSLVQSLTAADARSAA